MGLTDTPSSQGEYTTSTRHFLLIGFLGMFVGSVVFCILTLRKKSNNVKENVLFFITSIAAAAYYSMWSGYGVTKKNEPDGSVRYIFWGRYLDHLITNPLIMYELALLAEAELGDVTMLCGLEMLAVVAGAIGACVVDPYKWAWWSLGIFFTLLVFYYLQAFFGRVKESNGDMADTYRILLIITIVCLCIYPIIWVIGSEGLGAVSVDIEVAITALTDLIAKVGFGVYMLYAVVPQEEEGPERTSLV